ncbi:MAG: hypothetical protein KKB95_01350 [Gammaproteobacteria bacterium]|nr:hypothetical protein [Gammaproteobacteria bacterium]MBU1504520.1 hypothetical protein [Gammaproteobacteria bacterium]MBU2119382.1 hypothetical protein [Gammaproteobacteria bacterium]MBU2202851.1 hypothetical protein [Gammaproteobacteria bacterium]MBU2272590.1 hypothetical protein [Gammaproteobacteria bacterium]
MTQVSIFADVSSLPANLWRIEHAGAVTAVGSSAWQSAASWVGLQKRFRKAAVPGLGDVPITFSACPEVASSWPEESASSVSNAPGDAMLASLRIARLVGAALIDMLTGAQSSSNASRASPPICEGKPWPQIIVLALPAWLSAEQGRTLWQQSLEVVRQQGGAHQAKALSELPLSVLHSSHTAAFEGLELLNRSGPLVTAALLLAADSWMDLVLLQPEAAAARLITDKNQEGFVPGEAAAALWLLRVPNTKASDGQHLVLHPPALARSAFAHRDITREPNPDALTQVFREALSQAGWKPEHVGNKLSDSDGSVWRASAEMAATARVMKGQNPDEWQPATVLGQVGAATGAVHWALAAQRLRHDKNAPNSLLSWALDAGELAAAVAIERTIHDETLTATEQQSRLQGRSHTETAKTFSARFLNKKP